MFNKLIIIRKFSMKFSFSSGWVLCEFQVFADDVQIHSNVFGFTRTLQTFPFKFSQSKRQYINEAKGTKSFNFL